MSTITGTSSMSYNPYSQRSFVAQTNSKRDLALENYRDNVATKSAVLEWSNTTPATLALIKPSGAGPDGATRTDTLPQDQVVNPFTIVAIDTTTPIGNVKVITPTSIQDPYFKFTAANGTDAGYQCIKYLNNQALLVEVTGELTYTLNSNNTARDVGLAIYKNNLIVNATVTSFAKVGMDAAADTAVKVTAKLTLTLLKDDLVTLVSWRTDGSGTENVDIYDAKLSVRSII